MTIDDKIPAVPRIAGDLPGVRGASPKPAGLPEVTGADFSRILQELMSSAGKLDAKAGETAPESPQALQDAVAEAKESLDTAMSLSETLLEAYRRTLITNPEQGRGK